jgi:predicted small secreted protein
MKKFWIVMLAVVLSTSALAGCENTWHGAGADVEEMGEKMQDPNQ